jgi:hypothetical protein
LFRLVLNVIGHRGIVRELLHGRPGQWGGGIDVLRRRFVLFGVAGEDLPGNRKNAFNPRTVDRFDLAGLGDRNVPGRLGGDLTLGGEGDGGGFGFGFGFRGTIES